MVNKCSGCNSLLLLLLAALGFVWFLSVGSTATTVTVHSTTGFNRHDHHEVQFGREKLVYDPQLDFNYMMSKRKVPNGPDPIHNRRAGSSKRPPGRA